MSRELKLHNNIGSSLKHPLTHPKRLKAHDLQTLSGDLGVFMLMQLEGIEIPQRLALMELLRCLQLVCLKSHMKADLPKHHKRMVLAIMQCEMCLPLYFCTMSTHLLLHVFSPTGTIALLGPAQTTWMYFFEHCMGVLVKSLKSQKGVAKGVMEWYQVLQMIELWRMSEDRDWVTAPNPGHASGR
jgi:hypothetical protein